MTKRAPTRAKRAERAGRAERARRPVESARSPAAARSERRPRARRGSSRSAPAAKALRLPAECTLAGAASLKLRLSELVRSVSPVTLDTADVQRIDTAGMQLLAAFARDRRASALATTLTGESPLFEDSARLLGLAELLGCGGGEAPR